MPQEYLTVSQLTSYVARKFNKDPYLQRVYLTGEISNISRNNPQSHQYFTLKDDKSQLSVVMFKNNFQKVKFKPRDGDRVLVIGRLTVYEPRGNYQMIIEHMEADGVGQLYRLLEETKEKLAKEGLFSLTKKVIVKYPKKIAVITSESGAVIHDIIQNVKKRFPIVQLHLYPSLVQGRDATKSLVKNIQQADASSLYDTLIVARGGGSFEDLFVFNEESVVRAIAAAKTPVISSIGHETDLTLTDLVADYRASTPTEAAIKATPVLEEEILNIETTQLRLTNAFNNLIKRYGKRLERSEGSYVFQQPNRLYEQKAQFLDLAIVDLNRQLKNYVTNKEQILERNEVRLQAIQPQQLITRSFNDLERTSQALNQQFTYYLKQKSRAFQQLVSNLELLSPLSTLARGYSITKQGDQLIKSVKDANLDQPIQIQLQDGYLEAELQTMREDEVNPDDWQ